MNTINREMAKQTIGAIGKEHFSSHEFIQKFMALYEAEYKQMLTAYDTEAVQKTNARLARFLADHANELNLQKDDACEKSLNMHGNDSLVHWWRMCFLCLVFFLPVSSLWADDGEDFNQQVKGWEWVYAEDAEKKEIKTPYLSVQYEYYASHPQYRIIGNNVFDDNGNLMRRLLQLRYETRLDYSPLQDQYDKILDDIDSISDEHIKSLYELIGVTGLPDYYDSYNRGSNQARTHRLNNGRDYKKVISGKSKQVKTNLKILEEGIARLNAEENRVHYTFQSGEQQKRYDGFSSTNMCETVIRCTYNRDYYYVMADSIYKNAVNHLGQFLKKRGSEYLPLVNEVLESLKEYLVKQAYLNNKYNVREKESPETLVKIEEELGLREKTDTKKTRRELVYQQICARMNVEYTPGITDEEIAKAFLKKNPKITYVGACNKVLEVYKEILTKDVGTIALTLTMSENSAANRAANRYVNFLRQEYSDKERQFYNDPPVPVYDIAEIKRIDDVTFEFSIIYIPDQTMHKVKLQFSSSQPYKVNHQIIVIS
ncbi:MAG: hypothetical protein IKG96_05050 [Bacteroidaceae bacterium]|nr:hypothetical protein [Bacteroidaceae bacterium]